MLNTFISWNMKEVHIGILEIDKDHRKIINLINNAYKTLCKNKLGLLQRRYNDVVPIFDEFIETYSKHFYKEEKLLQERNYTSYMIHKAEHERLLFAIENFKGIISRRENNQLLINSFLEFINNWTYLHFTEDDQTILQKEEIGA